MVYFANKLELSGKKYQTNGNGRDENYKGLYYFLLRTLCRLVQIFSQCILWKSYYLKIIFM